jgi:hypothetical protein
MATSSSSHSNNNIPLATLLEWYKIRDTFFGEISTGQNVPLALEMAASCNHPDARWLVEVCTGKEVLSWHCAGRVFLALDQNDARALCFGWLCCFDDDRLARLRVSAELGFAFAQSKMVAHTQGEERFKFAQLAAAQGERDGFLYLGRCFHFGHGCEKDADKAKQNFLLAIQLGNVWAMIGLANLLGHLDPESWRRLGRAAALRGSFEFLNRFCEEVDLFASGRGSSAAVMFAIGEASRCCKDKWTRRRNRSFS